MDYWQPVFPDKCSSVNANENAVLGGKRSICLSTDVSCFATSYFSRASKSVREAGRKKAFSIATPLHSGFFQIPGVVRTK